MGYRPLRHLAGLATVVTIQQQVHANTLPAASQMHLYQQDQRVSFNLPMMVFSAFLGLQALGIPFCSKENNSLHSRTAI